MDWKKGLQKYGRKNPCNDFSTSMRIWNEGLRAIIAQGRSDMVGENILIAQFQRGWILWSYENEREMIALFEYRYNERISVWFEW